MEFSDWVILFSIFAAVSLIIWRDKKKDEEIKNWEIRPSYRDQNKPSDNQIER